MKTHDSIPRMYFVMFYNLLKEHGDEITEAIEQDYYVKVWYRFERPILGFAFQREYERQVKALEHESWLTKLIRRLGL